MTHKTDDYSDVQSSFSERLATVVIPAWNAELTIAEQLEALSSQTHRGPWELIVVDNGSRDRTVEVIHSFKGTIPSISIVSADERQGVSYARNVGASASKGEAILFCDADDVATSRWLESMLSALDEYDAVGGPLDIKSLNAEDSGAYAKLLSAPMDELPKPLGYLPIAPGGNCAMRAETFQRIGPFDESYIGGGEEVEFFWRLQLNGYTLGFSPNAIISYRFRSSLLPTLKASFAKARASARLYRDFRNEGVRFDAGRATRNLFGTIARSYRLIGPNHARVAWLARCAQTAGRIAGGVRYRVFYF